MTQWLDAVEEREEAQLLQRDLRADVLVIAEVGVSVISQRWEVGQRFKESSREGVTRKWRGLGDLIGYNKA